MPSPAKKMAHQGALLSDGLSLRCEMSMLVDAAIVSAENSNISVVLET
jgi:hypothetical protein